jgi:signal transduction histidine kinase
MTAAPPVGTVRAVPIVDRILERWRRLPPLVPDAGLAAVVGAVTAISIAVVDADDASERMTWWGWVLVAVQVLPLVARRRHPLAVIGIVGVASVVYGLAVLPDPAIPFPLAVAFYSLGAFGRRTAWVAVAAVAVGSVVLLVDDRSDAADAAVGYFVGVTSWLAGVTMRTQRERARWLAERNRDAAERAAADERVRIARDLHDVVGHHISVIAVQAEAAQEVLATRPERAAAAMGTVAETARAALGELRRAVGVLRSGPELAPVPGIAALDDLAASVRHAGLAVELRTSGDARPVDGVVGVTAYRVVQEALTNVLRHADAHRACVDLAFGDAALVVTVTDDGRGGDGTGERDAVGAGGTGLRGGEPPGHGLAGMRERVAGLGGRLDAGPGPGRGLTVRAQLPLPA